MTYFTPWTASSYAPSANMSGTVTNMRREPGLMALTVGVARIASALDWLRTAARTEYPASSVRWIVFIPMRPVPPVIRTRSPDMVKGVLEAEVV